MRLATIAVDHVDDRASYYLKIWAEWWRRDDTKLGYPSKVTLIRTQGAYWDSDDQLATLDNAAAEAADAVLQSIAPEYRLVLIDQYGAKVIRYGRLIQASQRLSEAHRSFYRLMMQRGFV